MNTADINNNYKNINDISFNQVWQGNASTYQIESLNSLKTDLNKCISDLASFDNILTLRDEYIDICSEISRFDSLISSCSVDHDDEESSCSCGYYSSQIQALEVKRKALREKIIGLLGQFSGITPEIEAAADLTTYDNVVVDDPKLLGEFNGEFPLYDQTDYEGVTFVGNTDIATGGCALTCAAMVISAYTGEKVTPDMLMEKYPYVYNNQTTMNNMMAQYGIKSANSNALNEEKGKTLSLTSQDAYIDGGFTEIDSDVMYFDDAVARLEEGYVCAFYMNPGDFTGGGHYILATGITEDGKILINDPYGPNYNKGNLQDGYENGFDPDFIRQSWGGGYLIEPYEDYKARQSN